MIPLILQCRHLSWNLSHHFTEKSKEWLPLWTFYNFNMLWSPRFYNADIFLEIYPIISLKKADCNYKKADNGKHSWLFLIEWWDRFQERCLHCRIKGITANLNYKSLTMAIFHSFFKWNDWIDSKKDVCIVETRWSQQIVIINFNNGNHSLLFSMDWWDRFQKRCLHCRIKGIKADWNYKRLTIATIHCFFQWNDGIDFKKVDCIVESRGSKQIKIIKSWQWQSFIAFFNGMMG